MADNKQGGGINPAAAGLVGAVVGVAAGAAAVALSDQKNRKKVQKVMLDIKRQGEERLDEFKKKAQELRNDAADQIEEVKDSADKTNKKLDQPKK